VLVVGSIPKSAVRFGAFEHFKKMKMDEKGNLKPVDRMLCGLGAGVCEAILAVTPMETIKGLAHDMFSRIFRIRIDDFFYQMLCEQYCLFLFPQMLKNMKTKGLF
jgi:hypothetical protein